MSEWCRMRDGVFSLSAYSMTQPFIIYALPRSRTYWLSKFLSYGDTLCGHEEIRHLRGLDDVKSLLDMPCYGSAETAAAPFWRLVQTMRPDIKTVVIRRRVEDVVASLLATGIQFDRPRLLRQMHKLDAKLDQIEQRVLGALSVNFDDLSDEATCARVFEYCTGQALDPKWHAMMRDLRLTCDLQAIMRYFQAHAPQIERVTRLAKQRMLAKLARRPVASDSMVFQQEPFDQFLEGAQHLFAKHLIEVGEAPAAWETKNLELMRVLESLGALYVTTARSNGRMFGYLMSVISPALDSQKLDGIHTLFYTSPDAPGVGLKLQRASVDFLRKKGVNQVSFRAGTRGSGEKISALFKRLGAEDAGHMYTLDLQESF